MSVSPAAVAFSGLLLSPLAIRIAPGLAAVLGLDVLGPEIDSRTDSRLRVAGAWPSVEARLGDVAYAVNDVSETGFQLALKGGVTPPLEAEVTILRGGEARQSGRARRIWTSSRAVGYAFLEPADLTRPVREPVFLGDSSADRLRRRLRL